MRDFDLNAVAQQNPEAVRKSFDRVEQALNMVLPGSKTHERYSESDEVGLAAVIALDDPQQSLTYSPFDSTTIGRLTFNANNRELRPSAWVPKETDEAILGGSIPIDMGRFTAYALAKINRIATSAEVQSYNVEEISISPGRVGVAGGIWLPHTLLGVSGLWEVHDHVGAKVLAHEVHEEAEGSSDGRTADDLAEEIEPLFERIKAFHKGVDAAKLNRGEVSDLLLVVNGFLTSHYKAPELDD